MPQIPEELQDHLYQLAESMGIPRETAKLIQESAFKTAQQDDPISRLQRDPALQLNFTQEQAESHIKEMLLIRPGNEIQFYCKDLSLRRGWFVQIYGEPMKAEGVLFIHYTNNHICLGLAPFGTVCTPTTVCMVNELKAWKDKRPSFMREDD